MAKWNHDRRRSGRLSRVEMKCDRILSELAIINLQLRRRPDIDGAIERMHRTARNMRKCAERERDLARCMFHPNSPE